MKSAKNPSAKTAGILQPLKDFLRLEAAAGILLMASTAIALLLSNSPIGGLYAQLWNIPLGLGIDDAWFSMPLLLWINDALMCLFFFLVGLEIKREFILGEFASLKLAVLPIAAAIGGMVVPALFYSALNSGTPYESGWGVPMATDIAFSLGVMALLGNRVPLQLKVFLTAFAIVDDLGAVLVIALFYGSAIQWLFLAIAGVILFILTMANLGGIRRPFAYISLGVLLWIAFFASGIHPTVAGVLLAFTVPVRSRIPAENFVDRITGFIDQFRSIPENDKANDQARRQSIVHAAEQTCHDVVSPLHRMESAVHPWVSYGILPLFALANAGVAIEWGTSFTTHASISFGIILGLLFGKQLGITLFAVIAVRLGLASLPSGITWRSVYAVSWLGAIGFTMSIFIANLAFMDVAALVSAKTAILVASCVAGIIGLLVLHVSLPKSRRSESTVHDSME